MIADRWTDRQTNQLPDPRGRLFGTQDDVFSDSFLFELPKDYS